MRTLKIALATAMLAGLGSIAAPSASAQCAGIDNSGTVVHDGYTIHAWERSCDVGEGDLERGMTISDANGVICTATTVDPSFDPFFFGYGVHNEADDAECNAEFSASELITPIVPSVPVVDEGYVGVFVTRGIFAEGFANAGNIHIDFKAGADDASYLRGVSVRS